MAFPYEIDGILGDMTNRRDESQKAPTAQEAMDFTGQPIPPEQKAKGLANSQRRTAVSLRRRGTLALTGATLALLSAASFGRGDATVSVDFKGAAHPRSRMGTFSVGSDRALIFLRPEHQRDLMALQKDIGFRYLRCHGLFNEEMKIVSRQPDGSLRFDWTDVDAFIGQLRKAKLKPFFELGFMPEAIASGRQTIFYWKGNVTPPAKMEEWSLLVSEFAKHLIAKYGAREVRNWYFEVWNEPNLDGFWTGGKQKYFELYTASARSLKRVDPNLRVGGPATAGMGWIPELLEYCRTNGVPIDFIASHSYAATQGFLDENGRGGGTILVTTPGTLVDEFTKAKHDIEKSAFPKIPLFITEWGPSYSPRDPIHDSYVCAPFILDKIRRCEGIVDGMSYWAFSDQFEEPGPPNTPFHGGFGLLNVDGLRKPAFFAYSMLSKLYGTEISVDGPGVVATKKGDAMRVLLWDYSPPKADAPNNPFYLRDIKPSNLGTTAVEIRNLPNGTYKVSRWGVGYGRNDVYDAFIQMKDVKAQGAHLPEETLRNLRASYAPAERLPDVVVQDGTAHIRLPMRTNDVWFLDIAREK